MNGLQERLYRLLRWSEKYTKTDMVYLFTSGVWGNLGNTAISLFSFLLYVAFAHFLSKEAYGTYQYLLALAGIVGTFTLTGMNTAVTQAIARGYEGVFKKAMLLQYRYNIVPMLGAWVFAVWYFAHGNYTLGVGLFLIGVGTPLLNTFNTFGAIFAGKKDFRRGFLYNFCGNVPYYASMMLVAYFYNAPVPLLLANLLSQTLATYVLYRRALKVYPLNDVDDPQTLNYGKHLSIMNVLGGIITQLDSVFVFHYLGAVDLAIYSFATAVPERLSSFFKFIPNAALPKFAVKTDEEIRRNIWRRTGIGLLAGAVVAAIYIVLAKVFFMLFFPAYMDAVIYSQVYAIMIVASIGSVFPIALTAKRRIKSLYIFSIAIPITQLLLQFVGVYFYGLWGLIAAKVAFWFIFGALALLLLFLENSEEAAPSGVI
jgi:O-antigen/teichoic acid export membrane protein